MEHKAYIDSLRGFAIFVVVIGHCCEFGLGQNNTLFNYMYYSFHMPLFMFISGLVAFHRPDYKFIPFVKSKACRLLIPFFVVGGLSCLARNIGISDFLLDFAKKGYWFLPVLFFIMLLMFPAYILSRKFNVKNSLWKDLALYFIPLVFTVACYKILPASFNNLLSIKYIVKLYPFVLMGMLTSKYASIDKIMNKDWVKCLLLIFTGILFAFIYRVNGAISIVGYFLVPVIYLLFKNSEKLGTAKCFSKMGGQTLQIYVLHYFMIPSMQSIANFIDEQQVFFINNHNFLLYAFISIIIASMVILCTLSVVKMIELSSVLNFIMFGIKHKRK